MMMVAKASRRRFYGLVVILMAMTASIMMTPLTPAAYAAGAADDEKEANRAVEMNAIVFPVMVDGKLVNYLFINSRLIVADGKSTWKYREQAHIIRDALLRAVHRRSVHLDGYPGRLDQALAEEVCVKAANEVMGEEAFSAMTFQQVASQRPY